MVMQHPAVVSYEEEEWNYQGKKRKVYRFEIDDISAYYYIRVKCSKRDSIGTVSNII
ncbi:hypothetical protein WIW90_03645 [Sulfolobaceae archaeon RB850M]